MQLVSVKKQNTFDATVSMIGRYIVEIKLGEGARLPPETELAGRLGVSRNILREAMQHYRTLGIITSAPKMEASRDAVLPELIQMRYAVETGAGRFMTAGATPERLARLEALADELDRTGEEARRLELDGELHAELLRLPGNALFTGLIPLVIDFFRQLRPEPKTQLTRERIGREHRDIIAALRGGDTEHLVRLLGSHIEIYFTERSDDDGAAAR